MKKLLNNLISVLLLILSMTIFATTEFEAPNEVIKDNPEREVTTVESMKTREHATMSLNITKVTPEEIMGKLEDGHLSVLISKKAKRKARSINMMGTSEGIDVSKLKLLAYSNPKIERTPRTMLRSDNSNLTNEDIRNMMKYTPTNNEKKITVVENNDDYVKLNIETVNENEKVYLAVMNGDTVVKSYRIGSITPYADNDSSCWTGTPASADAKQTYTFNTQKASAFTGGNLDWGGTNTLKNYFKDGTNPSYATGIKLSKEPNNTTTINLKDDYLTNSVTIKETRYAGVRIYKGLSNLLTTLSGKVTHGAKDALTVASSATTSKGASDLRKEYMEEGGNYFNGNMLNYEFPNEAFSLRFYGEGIVTSFKEVKLFDTVTGICEANETEGASKYMMGTLYQMGYDFGLNFNPPTYKIPGIYFGENIFQTTITRAQGGNVVVDTSYNIDLGDVVENAGTIIPKDIIINTYSTKSETIKDYSKDYENGLSLMFKTGKYTDNKNQSYDAGIWYNNQLINNSGNSFTVTSTNGNNIKITLTQKSGEFANLTITPTKVSFGDTFTFTLAQGRKVNGEIRPVRQINYTVNFPQVEESGNITLTLDPRINQLLSTEAGKKSWVTPSLRYGNWNDTTKSSYPDLIKLDGTFTQGVTISGIEDIVNKVKSTDANGYITYKNTNDVRDSIAIKKDVAINTLTSGSNLMLSPEKADIYETIFSTSGNNTKYHSIIKLQIASDVDVNGYVGSGTLDMSSGVLNQEYSFSAPTNSGTTSTSGVLTMTEVKSFPNTNSLLETGKSIATKLEVTYNGTSATSVSGATGDSLGAYKVVENLKIELLKTNILKLTKLSDNFDYTTTPIKIKYINNSGNGAKDVTLGTFDLKVKSVLTSKDIGTVNVNIDERLVQIDDKYCWLKLNGEVSNLATAPIGNYGDFVSVEGNFTNFTGTDKINSVEKINDTVPNATVTTSTIHYRKAGGENEGAFPFRTSTTDYILMSDFVKTGSDSSLVVSKWKISSSTHNGENKFSVKGTSATGQTVVYTGNIKEIYKNKNGVTNLPITNPSDKYFKGEGTLNLTKAIIGTEYSFLNGKTGDIPSSSPTTELILKITSGESLDATGIVQKTNESIAKKIRVTVGASGSSVVSAINGTKLEQNILEGSVTVGINSSGQLTVKKLIDKNIPSTPVKIEYFYSNDSNSTITTEKDVKLGEFTLTLTNPIVSSGDVTITLDPRLNQRITKDNWVTPSKKYGFWADSNKYSYPDLIAVTGEFTGTFTIETVENVEGKEKGTETDGYIDYKTSDKTRDGIAIKKNTLITNLATDSNLMLSPEKADSYKVTFTPIVKDSRYTSTISLKISDGVEKTGYTGSGTLNLINGAINTEYAFPIEQTGTVTSTGATDLNLIITGGTTPNSTGIVTKDNENIANKMRITVNGNTPTIAIPNSSNKLETNILDGKVTLGFNSKGELTIKKLKNENIDSTSVKIEYYYSLTKNTTSIDVTDIKLGEFNLTLENPIASSGDVTLTLDPRLNQLISTDTAKGSWVTPSGRYGNWAEATTYTDFIKLDGSFTGDFTIKTVESIEGKVKGTDNTNYIDFKTSGGTRDEIAIKKNIDITTLTSASNLMIDPGKDNAFKTYFIPTTEEKRYLSNITFKISSLVTKDGYTGSGSVNLANGDIGTEYSFPVGQTGEVLSTPEGLKLTTNNSDKTLNATGIFNTNNNKNIASKLKITVGSEVPIETTATSGKLETNILSDKVTIGISSTGGLTVKKLKNENINSTSVKIEYFYTNNTKEIKLGEFTLNIQNPVITSTTEMSVKIDKRLTQDNNSPNWLFKDGKIIRDILSYDSTTGGSQDYTKLFKYHGSLSDHTSGTIIKTIGVIGRETVISGKNYDQYNPTSNGTEPAWKDQSAIPKSGTMSDLENLVVVSKGNKTNSPNLDNRFSLLFNDGGTDKIYNGNIKEEIVGEGQTTGGGRVKLTEMEDNITYDFPISYTGTSVIGKDSTQSKTLTMTNLTGKLPDGNGLADISSGVIANKIKITGNSTITGLKTAELDSIIFSINSQGGLTLSKKTGNNLKQDTTYTIEFYYSPNSSTTTVTNDDVLLSTFTLYVEAVMFEIDGDNVLSFGNMVYRAEAPYETRVKEFKVKNPENKKIEFSVEKTSQMNLVSNKMFFITESVIELTNISVTKQSDTAFELQATANLTPNIQAGKYQGEIIVTVTISESK